MRNEHQEAGHCEVQEDEGCRACKAAGEYGRTKPGRGHSEACRKRIQERMREDEVDRHRVEEFELRAAERIAERVERRQRQEGKARHLRPARRHHHHRIVRHTKPGMMEKRRGRSLSRSITGTQRRGDQARHQHRAVRQPGTWTRTRRCSLKWTERKEG